jgi:hypothetical protein
VAYPGVHHSNTTGPFWPAELHCVRVGTKRHSPRGGPDPQSRAAYEWGWVSSGAVGDALLPARTDGLYGVCGGAPGQSCHTPCTRCSRPPEPHCLSGVGIVPGGSDWSPLPTDGFAYQGATVLDCLMLNGERDGVGLAGRVGVSPLSSGQHNYQTKG